MTDYYVIVMLFSWEKRAEEFQALEQTKFMIFLFLSRFYIYVVTFWKKKVQCMGIQSM